MDIEDRPPDHAATLTTLFREHHLRLVRMALLIVGDQPTAAFRGQEPEAVWSAESAVLLGEGWGRALDDQSRRPGPGAGSSR